MWAGIDPKSRRDELKGVFFSGSVFICQVTLREHELKEEGAALWWLLDKIEEDLYLLWGRNFLWGRREGISSSLSRHPCEDSNTSSVSWEVGFWKRTQDDLE